MSYQIYTTTGCVRCKIVKRYLNANKIAYAEYDFKAEGKEAFSRFYREHRHKIFRDQDGVEFPVFTNGTVIRQGVGVVIGYLVAGDALSEYISRSLLHGEWIDGFDISRGDPGKSEELIQVLTFLKQNGLRIQLTTDGRNGSVLEKIIDNGLADRVIMEVRGPGHLYEPLTGRSLHDAELEQSVVLTTRAPEYLFFTTVMPMIQGGSEFRYLTPEEVGQTAELIATATGSNTHPYELRSFDPLQANDVKLRTVAALSAGDLFKYRTAARRNMIKTEVKT
jgi:pyruvate formate lyase activating enzyme